MSLKKTFIPTLVTFLLFSVFSSYGVAAMLGLGKTCVFSSVKARLLLNGKPAAYAKVRREWNWNKPNSDEGTTDEQGYVMFPAVFESSMSRLLPIEIAISQRLLVEVNGDFKEFWLNDKREPGENEEYYGAPFDVVCELTDAAKLISAPIGLGKLTACKLNKGTNEQMGQN